MPNTRLAHRMRSGTTSTFHPHPTSSQNPVYPFRLQWLSLQHGTPTIHSPPQQTTEVLPFPGRRHRGRRLSFNSQIVMCRLRTPTTDSAHPIINFGSLNPMPKKFTSQWRNIVVYFAFLFVYCLHRANGGSFLRSLAFHFSNDEPAALSLLQFARNSSVSHLHCHFRLHRTTLLQLTTLKGRITRRLSDGLRLARMTVFALQRVRLDLQNHEAGRQSLELGGAGGQGWGSQKDGRGRRLAVALKQGLQIVVILMLFLSPYFHPQQSLATHPPHSTPPPALPPFIQSATWSAVVTLKSNPQSTIQQFNRILMTDKAPKREVQAAATAGSKKVKTEVDYSLWEDIGNQLRIDAARAVHVTKSGHPTSSASIADILAVLFFHQAGMKFHPHHPAHFLNDRLVLSKGHAAPALYAAFYRAGILTEAQLMSLRLKDSIIEGHPVPKIPFVDVATGSLGQGLSVAAGMAYSSKYLDHIDNRIFCITGDGEVAEGSIWEAAAFASQYKLGNLTLFVDVNGLGQSQATMYEHNVSIYEERFKAFGFNTVSIDGHSIPALISALQSGQASTDKPTAVICHTLKGKGFPSKIEGKLNWHGKDLGSDYDESIKFVQSHIKREVIPFETFPPAGDNLLFDDHPVVVKPNYKLGEKYSTRKAYGNGLLKAHESNKRVIGLDGDTKNSTFAITLFDKHPESFVECFIAEQNMVGVATGLSCRHKVAFCSTFAAFFIRAADQIRIAGIGGNNLKMAGSHSGCSIGEDGPSQMALEDLAFFRTLPNGIVLIPSDAVSTEKSVELAANYNGGPAFIRTARPDVPVIFNNDEPFALGKLKVLRSSPTDQVSVITVSVTTHEALKAYIRLASEGIQVRIIDLFSLKPLDQEGLRSNIQATGGKVIVAEEHYPEGGVYDAVCGAVPTSIKKISHLCVRRVPGSAKPEEQLEIHGLDANAIYNAVKEILK